MARSVFFPFIGNRCHLEAFFGIAKLDRKILGGIDWNLSCVSANSSDISPYIPYAVHQNNNHGQHFTVLV